MDSVENIKKRRIRLTIYSIVLIVLGMILGIVAFKLYNLDQASKDKETAINNQTKEDNKLLITGEELLNNYSNYLENVLYNKDDSITIAEAPEGYSGNVEDFLQYFSEADNLEENLHKYFSSDVTIDDLYTKFDYDNNKIDDYDEVKPNYTIHDNKYYIDGICNSTGNRALYSDFKVIERNKETAKLTYKITIMSIVDNSIMETYDEKELELTNEDGTWKISKGTIIGRCGLTYSIK